MQKIRDIIRLRLTTEMSERQIGRALKVSRTVVAKTMAQFRSSGLEAEAIANMSDSALEQAMWRKDRVIDTARYRKLEERFPTMVLELKKRGMTLEWLWKEYVEEHPDGYRYSQFCLYFQRWSAAGELWMHQEHKVGECMYADWAGEPLVVVNATTGADWPVQIYVGILGASGLTWVQANEDQKQQCWIRSNEGALRYFGGHTDALVLDYVPRNIIEDHPPRTPAEVFEGGRQSLQEGGLPLVAVEVHPDLTRGGQQAREGVDDAGDSPDAYLVRGPVDLHLLPRRRLEASLGLLACRGGHRGAQLPHLFGQDAPPPGVADLADLPQDAAHRQPLGYLRLDHRMKRLEFAPR
jgi:transposase